MKPLASGLILVVDDQEVNRYTTGRMLRDAGYTIAEARNGQEALRLSEAQPDLILLDVNLPDMDGFQICRILKSQPATHQIPVVHASATFVSDRDKAQGLDEGADGYLIRPFEPCVLIATVRSCIRARRAEDRISQQERELQSIADNTPDILTRFDRELRHRFVNAAIEKATGIAPEAVIGKTHLELGLPSPVCEVWEQSLRRAFDTGEPQSFEFTIESQSGERHLATRLIPEFKDIGHGRVVQSVLGITHDITDRRAVENDLADAYRRQNEFLATLAHELRNPLAPIRTGLELIRASINDPRVVEEVRAMMERQTIQMVRLVDDLLDLSRIRQDKFNLRIARVELAEVLNSAVESIRPFIDDAEHVLEIALPATPILLDADPSRLAQVFSNLLSNAAKYTPNGGTIRVVGHVHDKDVCVSVTDNGVGIPPEMQNRVFEMFAQIERSVETGYTGLGIGLTLVQKIVKMHGGSVWVQSEGVDKGSEFTVRLPLPDLSSRPAAAAAPAKEDDPLPSRRILVVDDNRDAAMSLSMVLNILGHEVQTVFDGEQALRAAEDFRPAIVLMDIGMPRMNGHEAARRIREQEWGRSMTLVALTGWGQDHDKSRTRDAGFDLHLTKPVEPATIQRVLNDMKFTAKT